MSDAATAAPKTLLGAAPALFVLLWATGFIGAKYGLPYAEPMTFLTIRFAIVAALLAAIALVIRAPWPTAPPMYFHLAVTGILVHGIYLGGVFSAIYLGVSAGISALIVGIQPIFTAALVGPLLGETVSRRQWAGFIIGFAGLLLVVWRRFHVEQGSWTGFALCIAAMVALTFGTLYQKRFCTGMDLRTGSLVQFAAAAGFTGALALAFESRVVEFSGEFLFALAWLCVVLSLGAMTLLWIMIRQGAASRVASLFYLVPPVTATMGYFLFGERLSVTVMAGIVLAAAGVAMVRTRGGGTRA